MNTSDLWIDVNEHMPYPNDKVLVFIPAVVYLSIYLGDGKFDGINDASDITHWIKVPDYPECVKNG